MQLIYKKSINIVAMLAMVMMLIAPYVSVANAATVTGSPNDYSLTINKIKQDSKGEYANEGLPGVEFTLKQTHSYDPSTNKWTAVANAKPITGVTNADGKIVFTKNEYLQLGRYEVQETDGPKNVILNKDVFTVDIPMTDATGSNLNYHVEMNPKNELIRGAVELTKTGEKNEALKGAEFALYKKGTPEVKIGDVYVTNAEGKIYVDGLEYGEYYFVETKAPDGHLLDKSEINFSIAEKGSVVVEEGVVNKTDTVVKTGLQNFERPKIEKDVEGKTHHDVNRDTEYTYNLTLDLPANIQDYKEYKVTDILDERLVYVTDSWTVKGTDESNIKFTHSTNAAGKEVLQWSVNDLTLLKGVEQIVISFDSKIKPGTAVETIPNYAILEFDNNHGIETKPVDPNNPPNPENPDPEDPTDPPTTPPVTVKPSEGGMKIIKVDASDNTIKLKGAEFKLTTDKAGENVVTANAAVKVNGTAFTGSLENLATNEAGELIIEGLNQGTYYLHETKAPTYVDENGETKSYRLLTAPKEVNVTNSADLTEVVVENSKSLWFLPQTGGLGTVLFTAVGLALMALALFVLKRRKQVTTQA
ncbi:SpaH/EbpB family LPXTG-anchored major pilin [Kurthia massiliensis]|uniref:SpaH/EbpB family LPXTG-anchored major pilin n=1 Tax=Kurthia massiliensis TaxID=1033739 RepID=UPI00028A1D63|nr:SpaH/EbpB family LPXTG-anchored major pilin [Kurthia massiliensis]